MNVSQSIQRVHCRALRRSLSPEYRQWASNEICQKLKGLSASAQHIGVYLAMDEEVDLTSFLNWALEQKKKLYAPVIQKSLALERSLKFFLISSETRYEKGSFGIREPIFHENMTGFPFADLDLVCVPLVAFDASKNRIGMGSGFYDRVLGPCSKKLKRPRLIGCAFDCQRVEKIKLEAWDIPMDEVVCESSLYL